MWAQPVKYSEPSMRIFRVLWLKGLVLRENDKHLNSSISGEVWLICCCLLIRYSHCAFGLIKRRDPG